MRTALIALFVGLIGLLSASSAQARSIYLNGTDISSARGQELKNVTVHINEKGDVFIMAPHYQVNEEDAYVPLSKFVQGMNSPSHKKPSAVKSLNQKPVPKFENGQLKKAGDPVPMTGAKKTEKQAVDEESKSDQ